MAKQGDRDRLSDVSGMKGERRLDVANINKLATLCSVTVPFCVDVSFMPFKFIFQSYFGIIPKQD